MSTGVIYLGFWAFPFTLLIVIAFINSMNLLDGQDGLAGAIAFIQVLFLLAFSIRLHHPTDMQLLIIIMVVLLTFLAFNMRFFFKQ